jgi:RNA polymerase sigma-70 factor (ECF subfamily)
MPYVPDDVVRRLAAACRTGDVQAVLDPDVVAVCDSGGCVPAPILPLHGAAEVAWLLHALLPGNELTVAGVNGRAGLVLRRAGRAIAVIALTGDHGRVTALWVVLNPAKLQAWHR